MHCIFMLLIIDSYAILADVSESGGIMIYFNICDQAQLRICPWNQLCVIDFVMLSL